MVRSPGATAAERCAECCWPSAEAGAALQALARRSGLAPERDLPPTAAFDAADLDAADRCLAAVAEWFGLETEPLTASYAEIESVLQRARPALWAIPGPQGYRLLAVLRCSRGALEVIAPAQRRVRLPLHSVREALCAPLEAAHRAAFEPVLARARIPARRAPAVRHALLGQMLANSGVGGGWLLRPHPSRSADALRRSALRRRMAQMAGAHAALYALTLAAWKLLAARALSGAFDPAGLVLWSLILLTALPFRVIETWCQGRLGVEVGQLLKQRLLVGALRLAPDHIRSEGTGKLLGRVIESELLEQLLTTGGFSAAVALLELLVLAAALAAGAGGVLHCALLGAWTAGALLLALALYRLRTAWAAQRLSLTGDLVEKMLGHRTRLAQLEPADWHDGEDAALARYFAQSRRMDFFSASLVPLLARGWMVASLLVLLPGLLDRSDSASSLAASLGGTLFASQALTRLAAGLSALIDAAVAWPSARPMLAAASTRDPAGVPELIARRPVELPAEDDPGERRGLLEARQLGYRHPSRAEPVVRDCSFTICAGDRILLEGASGSGKSTLAALLVGLRTPESGGVFLDGMDRFTLGGEAWRRRVALAPQFHDNLILTGTLAFNLLMGRRWPPRDPDLVEARQVCEELGLGSLLRRMPSGLLQQVGEAGWQLSHGERSRIFIARTLLQGADVVILDESFAALDPRNLSRTFRAVLERARTVVLIAHP